MIEKIKKWYNKITGSLQSLPKENIIHPPSEKPDMSSTTDPLYEKKEKIVKHPKTLNSSWN